MTFKNHFKALFRKNYILGIRNWKGSICEILVPILFGYLLIYTKNQMGDDISEETESYSYLENDLKIPFGTFDALEYYPEILKQCLEQETTIALAPDIPLT